MEESPQAVQIVSPSNHSFELHFFELERILGASDIRDRYVVVVSIAGAFRKGKSFLMNFFLRYLEAEYTKKNVNDWLTELNVERGFKSRGGQQPETTGIWMWSDVFTHDHNGKELAIILLDTQGIFDNRSSVKDCITIFALSMMLASVQCYNLMQNVQEDDLQHLELFSEYGKLVLGQSNEKPFQKLLFIVRDWPNSFETGMAVAQGGNLIVQLQQIESEFIKYVKELAPAIFAPENLIIKKVNGQELRTRDWIQYIQTYTGIFNVKVTYCLNQKRF
ncbi:atlastin-like [Sitodiplosis mosellana]|uniref:atlastin-like n=1 Tax=Sitodiplosis mosellana TaxID=263140 RepID=UPI002443D28A|nr:atlastin-like [Sitodiplosis mosellana]